MQRGTYPYVDETTLKRFTSQLHKYEQGMISAYGYLEYSKPLTAEQIKDYTLMPSPQNHLETVEKTEEQNYNQIDGILNNLPADEAAISIDGSSLYLAVQTCDSGYDYTFFNQEFEELDGGQLDNPEFSMAQAIHELLSDEGWEQAKLEATDYDTLMERAEAPSVISGFVCRQRRMLRKCFLTLVWRIRSSLPVQKSMSAPLPILTSRIMTYCWSMRAIFGRMIFSICSMSRLAWWMGNLWTLIPLLRQNPATSKNTLPL